MANNTGQINKLQIRKRLNHFLIKESDGQLMQSLTKAQETLDWLMAKLAPWAEYGSNVLAAAITTSSKCFPPMARHLHLRVRRFEGVFGGLL